jgi:hypothetical protein
MIATFASASHPHMPSRRHSCAALSVFVALAGLSLGPGLLSGQHRYPHTIEIWGGAASWSGENAEGFDVGAGTGATFLFDVGWPVQIGGDLAFSRFETDQILDKADEFSGSLALSYRILPERAVVPFLGMRVGYTRLSARYETLRFEQNGGLFGGATGIEVPLRGRLMLSATAEALYHHYADAKIFLEDEEIPASGGGAWRYWGRVGIEWRWGPGFSGG